MFVSGNFFAHKPSDHNGSPGLKNENKNRRKTVKNQRFSVQMVRVGRLELSRAHFRMCVDVLVLPAPHHFQVFRAKDCAGLRGG